MKKLVTGMVVVIMAFALAACGGSGGGASTEGSSVDPIVGDWGFHSMNYMEQEINAEQLTDMGVDADLFTLTITEDGKISMETLNLVDMANVEKIEGTWENKDGAYSFTMDGHTQAVTLDGNLLSMESEGTSLVFSK